MIRRRWKYLNWTLVSNFLNLRKSKNHWILTIISFNHEVMLVWNVSIWVRWPCILQISSLTCIYKLVQCSCPFARYFRKLFWDDILIIWDENIVYLIFINKLSCYHPKIMYENIVQKVINKFYTSHMEVHVRDKMN